MTFKIKSQCTCEIPKIKIAKNVENTLIFAPALNTFFMTYFIVVHNLYLIISFNFLNFGCKGSSDYIMQ